MRPLFAACFALLPGAALACGAPVCLVDPDSLSLPRVITFEDVSSGMGPGRYIPDVLKLDGASFGERFMGQNLSPEGAHDRVSGSAFGPLTMIPGAKGENLSVVKFYGETVINGFGPAGFPRREAQGEGAIAVLFDEDQSALAFDLRGGEDGVAYVSFYSRDGAQVGVVPISPTGEFAVGFLRSTGQADLAGFIITNQDPQGLAIDTIRFGKIPDLS